MELKKGMQVDIPEHEWYADLEKHENELDDGEMLPLNYKYRGVIINVRKTIVEVRLFNCYLDKNRKREVFTWPHEVIKQWVVPLDEYMTEEQYRNILMDQMIYFDIRRSRVMLSIS